MGEARHPFIQAQICSGSPPICIPLKKGYLSTWQKAGVYCYPFKPRGISACGWDKDTVPEHPFAIEPKGAFSTSPKTQQHGMEMSALAWSPSLWHRAGAQPSTSYSDLQSRASYRFNRLNRPTPPIAASFCASSSQQARLPGMKFHCKQSPSSHSPRQKAVGSTTLLPGPHSPPALLGDEDMGQQPHRPGLARLPPQAPAHSSLHTLPTKGLLSPSPWTTQRPECCHGIETPPEKS